MSIIEIYSSESDDDIEIRWDLPNRPSNNGTSTSRIQNGASNTDVSDVNRSNVFHATQFNGDEVTSCTNYGLNAAPMQKRTLPPSFQSFTSKPSSCNNTRSHESFRPMKPISSHDADLRIRDDYKSKDDNKFSQHNQQRILPPSLQQTGLKTTSGHFDYKRKMDVRHLPYEYESSNKLRVSPSSSMNDDVHIYKTVGTQRVLPPSLMNGKPGYNPHVVSSNDIGNRAGLAEQRFSEHEERAIYQEALKNLGQPNIEEDLPRGLLSVSLLKHQKLALGWMVEKEKSVHCAGGILADDQGLGKTISMIALIQKQRTQQSKFTSNNLQQIKPEALNLDDDGDDYVYELDKGKQLLEVNLKNEQVNLKKEQVNLKKERSPSTSMHASGNLRPAAGTLVVCPTTVLRQWARELDEKVSNDAKLSVLIYHGGARTRDPAELAKYDVVLTTYAIVTNELPKQNINRNDDDGDKYELSSCFSSKRKKETTNGRDKGKRKAKKNNDSQFYYDCGPLARVRWFRVILDEAQTIKNYRTQVARACSGLRAKRRWCLSGTPIQNSIDDLYSYFRFLKYDPYASYSSFCSSIKFPISKNSSHGYKKLQAVLRNVLLRRTKDMKINGEPIINLPPKSIILKKADFSPEERSFYLKLEGDSRQEFKKYAAAGTVSQNYASILLLLLRLRQACDHPVLVKGYKNSDTVGKASLDMARKLPKDMQFNLLQKLEGTWAICGVCNDPPEDAVATMCGHVFCYQCVSEHLTGDDNLCPMIGCRETLATNLVFSRATLQSSCSVHVDNFASSSGSTPYKEVSVVQSSYVSSKIKAAIEILNSLSNPFYNVELNECDGIKPKTENPVKAIIFSQWTGMLDLLEYSLNQSLFQYRRLDGSMSLAARDKAVKDFNTDPEVTVMIMSLKAGNLGLNMVAASHVILLDLWWNPTTEDQAVDRAHRIGQTRPVTVSRLTIKDTIEDRILALQEEKRQMVASAFGEDQTGGRATKLTVEDLSYLFMG